MAGHREVLVVAALFFIFSWLAVSLRVYVRGFMVKSWGRDDSCTVACLLVFTVYLSFQITAALHGIGRHQWDLTDQDRKTALLFWYLCEILFVLLSCLLKFAIGYFYLRVVAQRWHIWTIKLLMAGTVFFGIIYLFLTILQCLPVNTFWNRGPATSQCLPKGPTLGTTYSIAVINAAADWALGTLPISIIWDLEMKFKTKLLVVGILAFAAIGSIASVVRMFYIHTLTNQSDFLYVTTDLAIWATVEIGIGITASSIATLRPLIQCWLWRLGLASAPYDGQSHTYHSSSSGLKRSERRSYCRSTSLSDLAAAVDGNRP